MNITALPPQKYLQECFCYCEDGTLVWKERPLEHFASKRGHSIFLKQTANKKVGSLNENGYIVVTLNFNGRRLSLKLHRVIWAMFNEDIPTGYYIDHWDTNKQNNKIANLRLALPTENSRNELRHFDNTSGIKGVSWNSKDLRWVARITENYTTIRLGAFKTIAEAEAAIRMARPHHHKEFTNHGTTI